MVHVTVSDDICPASVYNNSLTGDNPASVYNNSLTGDNPASMYNNSLTGDNQTWLYPHNTNITADSLFRTYTVYVVWSIITSVGSVGNVIVIQTMYFHGDRSATSYYIINLALTDLAFILIVVPFTLSMFITHDWLFGNGICKLVMYMIYVTLQATCLTLTAMAIDRYFAIVHPIKSINSRTPQMSIMISVGIWVASLCLSIPFLLFNKEVTEDGQHTYCRDDWPNETWRKGVALAVVMTTYVIPLTIIIVCYTQILKHISRRRIRITEENEQLSPNELQTNQRERYRKKVTKMVAIVVILFASLWLPIHVFNLCVFYLPGFPKTSLMLDLKVVALTLCYSNSCVNPFVYAFHGDGFRRAFRKSLASCARNNRVRPVVQSEAWHTNDGRDIRGPVRSRVTGYSSTTGL
ncbi:G-protein coupled receptor 54-like [Gigantopelta aegis]|uniref:G-protein coupled receptor 54-like n=1 Tax=Gigantopelta aegis TaxID=1735272 RepID=UPI001B88A816|nr:G-protein coupled receptor 54-like [Gigantopelta aegis]